MCKRKKKPSRTKRMDSTNRKLSSISKASKTRYEVQNLQNERRARDMEGKLSEVRAGCAAMSERLENVELAQANCVTGVNAQVEALSQGLNEVQTSQARMETKLSGQLGPSSGA